MEVFFDEFSTSGVSRLGVYNLPSRLIEANFGHLGTKSGASVGPVDVGWKGLLGDMFPFPLAHVRRLSLPLCTSYGPLRSDRRCSLGGKANVRNTDALRVVISRADF